MRHARAVMHAEIANYRFPVKSVAGETFLEFPAHAQPAILRIWQGARKFLPKIWHELYVWQQRLACLLFVSKYVMVKCHWVWNWTAQIHTVIEVKTLVPESPLSIVRACSPGLNLVSQDVMSYSLVITSSLYCVGSILRWKRNFNYKLMQVCMYYCMRVKLLSK